VLFHFGEFSRLHQSFINVDKCLKSNISSSTEIFFLLRE